MAFAALTIDLNAKLAKFEQDMQRANRSLDTFGAKATAAANGIKTAFGALGGAVAIGSLAAFAKTGIDAADALNDLSSRTGVAVKDLASLKLAAQLSDTSLDGVGKAIQRLNLSVGQAQGGNKAIAESLRALGVNSADARERLFQIADAYKASGGQGRALADIQAVLGKSYTELIPLLEQGGDGLRQMAQESESFAQTMERLAPEAGKFNDEMDKLRQNAASASAEILAKLVPALNEVFERTSTLVSLYQAGGLFNTLVNTAGARDYEEVLSRVRREIALTEEAVAGKRAAGRDSSAFEEKLRGLNAQLAVLLERKASALMEPPPSLASGRGAPGTVNIPTVKTLSGGAKSDPLASLLGQTDIAKLREFEKNVALLNQRFAFGKKDAELYAQAMTILVERTFADNFKQAAEDAAFMSEVLRDGQETINEANQNTRDWLDTVARTKTELIDMVDPVNALVRKLTELDKFEGFIDPEILAAARLEINAQIDALGKVGEKFSELDTFAKKAAENIQDAFADFLFDPFGKGLKGMLQGFGQTIQRMIADAVAADLTKWLFGDLVRGGSGSGVAGGLLTSIGNLFGFANGGIMTSAGPLPLQRYAAGGIASSPQLALFGEGSRPEAYVPLPDGRNIPVKMQGGGGNTIIVNVNGTSAPDVRRAAAQGAREALGMLEGARRYG